MHSQLNGDASPNKTKMHRKQGKLMHSKLNSLITSIKTDAQGDSKLMHHYKNLNHRVKRVDA